MKNLAVEVDRDSSIEIKVLAPAVSELERDVRCRAVMLLKPRDELASPFALGVGALVVELLVDRTDQGGDVRTHALKAMNAASDSSSSFFMCAAPTTDMAAKMKLRTCCAQSP
eukprot:6211791-Pleurochrysis_carterae.AAC.1